jgi:hypothetical protein
MMVAWAIITIRGRNGATIIITVTLEIIGGTVWI